MKYIVGVIAPSVQAFNEFKKQETSYYNGKEVVIIRIKNNDDFRGIYFDALYELPFDSLQSVPNIDYEALHANIKKLDGNPNVKTSVLCKSIGYGR